MAQTWYDEPAVTMEATALVGGAGPPANTYYYIIIPYIINDAGISPDHNFYYYRPQYYGKRSTEISATPNGAQTVRITWTRSPAADGYVIFRTITSGNYNVSGRDRYWNVGDVATYDDINAGGVSYKVNVPERQHGCVVITTGYALRQLLTEADIQGMADTYLMGLGSDEFNDDTITNTNAFYGLAFAQFFSIHIHSGGYTYPGFYDNQTENQLWFMWSQIYINNGGTFFLGSTTKNANHHGNCHFVFNRSNMQNQIYGVPGGMFKAFGASFGQWVTGGSSNYIDMYLNCEWDAGALIMSNCRTLGISGDGSNDMNVDGVDYFESYYQFGLRNPAGAGVINIERYRAHEAGRYIFMRGSYAYTLKDLDYSDWRVHTAPEDAWFYDPAANPFTGAIVCINPSWKVKTSAVPNIIITDSGNQHTGSLTVKFEVDIKVTDTDGVAIAGATVTVNDLDGNVLATDTTAADGTVSTMTITHAIYTCDVANALVTTNKYPHEIVVGKAGFYQTLTYNILIDHPLDMTVPLQEVDYGELSATLSAGIQTASIEGGSLDATLSSVSLTATIMEDD